jgi:hypothetical protein
MAAVAKSDVKTNTIVKCLCSAGFITTDETKYTSIAKPLSSTTAADRTGIDSLFDWLRDDACLIG